MRIRQNSVGGKYSIPGPEIGSQRRNYRCIFSNALGRSASRAARDFVSLALVRMAHEKLAVRLVPAVLASSGDDRSGLETDWMREIEENLSKTPADWPPQALFTGWL